MPHLSRNMHKFLARGKLAIVLSLSLLASVLLTSPAAAESGWATWYGQPFHGRTMYGGQVYDMYDPTTTACNIYPLGTWVKVTNPANGHSVVVQVRDRGGFGHAVDLSYAAFAAISDPVNMMIRVEYEVVSGPDGAPVATNAPAPEPTPAAASEPEAEDPVTEYTVAVGDTLFAIAQHFGIDTETLIKWNGLANPDLLVAGQRLVLRDSGLSESASRSPRTGDVSVAGVHIVAEGDTLWEIAEQYGTTPDELIALNDLSDDGIIIIDQELRLPGGQSSAAPASTSGQNYVIEEGDTLLAIALRHNTTVSDLMALNGLDDAELIQIGHVLALP